VFDLSLGEMGVIAVLVIVFVGPDGLPDLMRVLGRFYAQINRASMDLRRTFNAEVARVDADRRREELRERREAREKARAASGEALPQTSKPEGAEPEHDPDLIPADPRLPTDAAPRRVPAPGAVPRPAAPQAPQAAAEPAPAAPALDPEGTA
jgi:Sec-independent protein translocase protein TatA